MYLVFIRMPGESYRRVGDSGLRCCVHVASLESSSLVCWFDYLTNVLINYAEGAFYQLKKKSRQRR